MQQLPTFRAAACKKSTRKNKLIRKNKSTRTEIFRYKISVLVDLFFLINLFFSYWLLHEAALDPKNGNIVVPSKYISKISSATGRVGVRDIGFPIFLFQKN